MDVQKKDKTDCSIYYLNMLSLFECLIRYGYFKKLTNKMIKWYFCQKRVIYNKNENFILALEKRAIV